MDERGKPRFPWFALLVLLGCVVVVCSWPAVRRMAWLQLRLLTGTTDERAGYGCVWGLNSGAYEAAWFEPYPRAWQGRRARTGPASTYLSLAGERPEAQLDALLAAALAEVAFGSEPPSLVAAQQAAELAPDDPRVWAATIYHHLPHAHSPESNEAMAQASRRGVALEPQNGFWHLAEAVRASAVDDMDAALEALSRAAGTSWFFDYQPELRRAVFNADSRVSDSEYRALWVYYEGTHTNIGGWHLVDAAGEVAARLEKSGRMAEAMRAYEAVLDVDRTRRACWGYKAWTGMSQPWTWRVALKRRDVLFPDGPRGREQADGAVDDLVKVARREGREDIAERISANVSGSGVRHHLPRRSAEAGRDPHHSAAVWRLQLMAMALVGVWVTMAAGASGLARALRRGKGVWSGLGAGATAALLLLSLAQVGLLVPLFARARECLGAGVPHVF